jgi:hypothetical protein
LVPPISTARAGRESSIHASRDAEQARIDIVSNGAAYDSLSAAIRSAARISSASHRHDR